MPITRTAVLAVIVVAVVLLSWMEAASGKSSNHATANVRQLGSKRNATIRDISLNGRQHFSALPQNLRQKNDPFWTSPYRFDKFMENLRKRHEEEEGEFADEGETCAREQGNKVWIVLKPCNRWLVLSNRHCRDSSNPLSKNKVCVKYTHKLWMQDPDVNWYASETIQIGGGGKNRL